MVWSHWTQARDKLASVNAFEMESDFDFFFCQNLEKLSASLSKSLLSYNLRHSSIKMMLKIQFFGFAKAISAFT